jgi:hypothetical protein
MRWDRPPVRQTLPAPKGYVHHSAGGRLGRDAFAAFRALNEMAIGEGMSAIDYTWLVHLDPVDDVVTVGEARGQWTPAATYNQNPVSKAVCLMGYFHPGHKLTVAPTDLEIQGIVVAFRKSIELGWLIPRPWIGGHRDNPYSTGSHSTACPGDLLYPYVPAIAAAVLNPTNPPTPAPPTSLEDDMIPAVAKTTNGPYLAQFGFRGPILTMGSVAAGHQVDTAEVFGRGDGRAFDVVSGTVVSWSPTSPGSWAALKPSVTVERARQLMMGAK